MSQPISPRELEWTAGFLDGEGSFGFYNGSVRVCAHQVQKWPLERLQKMFGGSLKLVKRQGFKPREIWAWNVSGPIASGLCMTIYSLLSPRRQEKVKESLAVWRSRPASHKYKANCYKGHPLSGTNLKIEQGRWRRCLACRREREHGLVA